jgi:hypothetical protein
MEKKIKFGPSQTGKPVPQWVGQVCDFLAGLCGILSGFLTVAEFIPQQFSNIASPVLTALLIPLLLYVKRWFGVEVNTRYMETDQVSEIKNESHI